MERVKTSIVVGVFGASCAAVVLILNGCQTYQSLLMGSALFGIIGWSISWLNHPPSSKSAAHLNLTITWSPGGNVYRVCYCQFSELEVSGDSLEDALCKTGPLLKELQMSQK